MVRVHLSRPVQVQGKGDRGDPDFRSLLYGGRFLSYQECVGEARERRIGSRGDAYASSLSIGFPSFAVSGEGDKTRARHRTCSILNLHPSLVISIRFSYSLVHCALQLAAPLLVRENASRLKSQQLVRSRACPFLIISKIGLEPHTNKVLLAPSKRMLRLSR